MKTQEKTNISLDFADRLTRIRNCFKCGRNRQFDKKNQFIEKKGYHRFNLAKIGKVQSKNTLIRSGTKKAFFGF